MAILNHVYSKTPAGYQFSLIYADAFPPKSLLFGSDARKFCELLYTPKAAKTGGGFGSVIIDEFGVPSIVGVAGEYTFTWYVNDKTDGLRYGPYTCTMTSTPFADVTAPTVAITTTGDLLDLRPALVGTVNDATARIIVNISNKDYVATNDGVGGWSVPINTIDQIPIDVTTVTVYAIDNYDNVGSASTTIYYNGSQYSLVHDFDVAANATTYGWVDGQDVSSLVSSIGTSALGGTTATTKPSYVATDKSLQFTLSPADRMYNNALEPFREIFVVLTDMGVGFYANVFQIRSPSGSEPNLTTGGANSQWRINSVNVAGRLFGQKQVLHLRYGAGTATISTNGGTEYPVTAPVSDIDLTKIFIHETNFNGANLKIHEIATAPKLNVAQRTAVITDLKTKWGIA